jgi:hypothetical protein
MDGINRSFFTNRDPTSSEKKRDMLKRELHSFECLVNEKLELKHNVSHHSPRI